MRRKPTNGTYNNNNQHRRPQRFQQNGGGEQRSQGGSYQHSGHGRPRRNYGAAREKYLTQARDALAAGDRVLAENYFQHADHCYRMMVEEGQLRPNYTPPPQQNGEANGEASAPVAQVEGNTDGSEGNADGFMTENNNALPAFLHVNPEQPAQQNPVDPATIQNWEERDA